MTLESGVLETNQQVFTGLAMGTAEVKCEQSL